MIGYSEEEISNTVEEWKSRVHPADLKRVEKRLQDCLDGEIPHYETEHRLKTKDGSYRWILDRGKVVSRDDNGKRYVHSTLTLRNLKIA
jgi:PAS domain S-box-containing protein